MRPSAPDAPAGPPAGGPDLARPLRVLHLNFHRGWGGQPQRILMLSIEMNRRGHHAAIAAPAGSMLARRADQAGLPVFGDLSFRPPLHLISFLKDARRLRSILRTWSPDIVHSHGSQDTWIAVAANRWCGGPRLPHVLTRHNTKRVGDTLANRYLYGRALDMLVVASAGVLERYRPFIERGLVVPSRVPVIHSAIDIERFSSPGDPSRIRRELGLSPADRLITCVGRLVEDKGQRVLLDAAALLRERHPQAFYAFVGVGTEDANLRRQADRLGLGERVFFLGFREDVADITAAADVSVLPSVDCDASSAVIKEAMAAGCPVVATDVGGAREILSGAGLVVPSRDAVALSTAMDHVLSDPEAGRKFGERGRKAAGHYTAARLCDRYLEAYRSLLARRRSPRSC